MKINNFELLLIIILIIKSKNDSNTNNISNIFSINPMYHSTNEDYSSTNISLTSSNIISTLNNDKNIFQFKSPIPSMNSTLINKNNITLGQIPNLANNIIEKTIPKISSTFSINNNTPNSLIVTNTYLQTTAYIHINNNSLIFLRAYVMDYFLKIYFFYEKEYPNSLKIKIYIDINSRKLEIIREKQFVVVNYTRNKNHIIEYSSNLTDYQNTKNFNVTIEKIDIVEEENDNKNIYNIYFGVDENNLNLTKVENLTNKDLFNFSHIFNKENYNYHIYDVQNISEGCNFFINTSENKTIYNGNKNLTLMLTNYYNDRIINSNCMFSSEYIDQIPCILSNQTNSNYIFKSYVYPFEDEIFIFKQKNDRVFHLLCNKTNKINGMTKIIIVIIVLSIIIVIGFIFVLIVVCHKHKDSLSQVSNKSITNPSSASKGPAADSSMNLD